MDNLPLPLLCKEGSVWSLPLKKGETERGLKLSEGMDGQPPPIPLLHKEGSE